MIPREFVWSKLSGEWKTDKLIEASTEITLNELDEKIKLMLKGQLKGRTIVKIAL